jgi:hypothetical protein
MKTKKLKDNATIAERYEFLAKCARHMENGGEVIFRNAQIKNIGFYETMYIEDLIIHHKPKTKIIPYTAETFPKDWNKRFLINKEEDTAYQILTVDFKYSFVMLCASISPSILQYSFKELLSKKWSDGSQCGIEVEDKDESV